MKDPLEDDHNTLNNQIKVNGKIIAYWDEELEWYIFLEPSYCRDKLMDASCKAI